MLESARALCTTPDCAPAEGWDNFANNLGSDLAPLLALFGEQVTTQYLSETMSVEECILFALAPLGIITAIVADIRVAGSSALQAIIGRAKETRGDVEADLMSSTSTDVCELWSGEGVVRVIGTPKVLQLVYRWSEEGDSGATGHFDLKAGILNFQDKAAETKFYTMPEPPDNDDSDPDIAPQDRTFDSPEYRDIERWLVSNNPPNLSLYLSITPRSPVQMASLIIVGIIVQGAVLVLAAVSQYNLHLPKNDSSITGYAFPVFLFETMILAVGVFLCATVVDTTTVEKSWKPNNPKIRVVWLQQGGHMVGDQTFESFARIHTTGKVTTSQKKRVKDGFSGKTLLANTAVGVTLLGFITQFFGLRATHSSVIVLQLVAILVMTALRSYAHSNRNHRNHIADPYAVREYELDWLAKSLGGCFSWQVRHLPSPIKTEPTAGNLASSLQPGVSQSALGLTPDTGPAPPTIPPTGENSTDNHQSSRSLE